MHLVEHQERGQHGRRDLHPRVAAAAPGQPAAGAQRGQPSQPDQHGGYPVDPLGGQVRQAPVPDRVRGEVRLAAGLEPVGGPPPGRAGQQHRQVDREPDPGGSGQHPQRAAQVPGHDPVGQQRQHEEARVDLGSRAEAERRAGQTRAAADPGQHRAGHAGGGQEVPVVHAVEHHRRRSRPDHRPPAGEPDQQPTGQQPEREQQHGGLPQVVRVGAGRQPGQPHEHPGDHRVLDRPADQLAAVRPRDEPSLQVREEVLAHAPADPELLDVAVAEVAVLEPAEALGDAEAVEGGSGALPLQQVRPEHPDRGQPQRDDDQHRVGSPADGGERGPGQPAVSPAAGNGGRRCRRPAPRRRRASPPAPGRRPPRPPR